MKESNSLVVYQLLINENIKKSLGGLAYFFLTNKYCLNEVHAQIIVQQSSYIREEKSCPAAPHPLCHAQATPPGF